MKLIQLFFHQLFRYYFLQTRKSVLVALSISILFCFNSYSNSLLVRNSLHTTDPVEDVQYFRSEIAPIINTRCIQCHSCSTAPCQAKFTSAEGLQRGLIIDGKKSDPYRTSRVRSAIRNELGTDANSISEWRERGFYPVTNSTELDRKNPENSLLYSLILQRSKFNSPVDDLTQPQFQAEESRTCPTTPSDLNKHLQLRPEAGMPYGLPTLSPKEVESLRKWTEMGSPIPLDHPFSFLSKSKRDIVIEQKESVEKYLNQFHDTTDPMESERRKLVSRYLYEHLFLAHIYVTHDSKSHSQNVSNSTNAQSPDKFSNSEDPYFRLIRSSTPCLPNGENIEIPTRRPWDNPGESYFYCLKISKEYPVHKNHIVYTIDSKKLERWEELFFSQKSPSWNVSIGETERHRNDEDGSNPFVVFSSIPAKSRYQFLLDDIRYTVLTFIRGPVCKGSVATNSIDEQFYTLFIDPSSDLMVRDPQFEQKSMNHLILPSKWGSDLSSLKYESYRSQLNQERNLFKLLRYQTYSKEFPNGYSLNDIWKNKALTIFRHHDSAAVDEGLIGATPKTIFVLDYALLERLVYLLTTGYDLYASFSHHLLTRVYMNYLRMEAEENFLSFLPEKYRTPMLNSWYPQISNTLSGALDLWIWMTNPSAQSENLTVSGTRMRIDHPYYGGQGPTQVQLDIPPQNDQTERKEYFRSVRRSFIDLVLKEVNADFNINNSLNPDKEWNSILSDKSISNGQSESDFDNQLKQITNQRAKLNPWVSFMPSLSMIVLVNDDKNSSKNKIYSLIRNKELSNNSFLFSEIDRRDREEDTLVAYKGVLGSYPNQIFVLKPNHGYGFILDMIKIKDHDSYENWVRKYGSVRSGPGSEFFWSHSDLLHKTFQIIEPREYGAFDYSRFGIDYRYAKDDGSVAEITPPSSDFLSEN